MRGARRGRVNPLMYGTLIHAQRPRATSRGGPHRGGHRRVDEPATGATYRPAGRSPCRARSWRSASPTVPQQELDTRATTGVVYWEGSQHVTATAPATAAVAKATWS